MTGEVRWDFYAYTCVRSHSTAREKPLTVQDDYKKIFCTGFFSCSSISFGINVYKVRRHIELT